MIIIKHQTDLRSALKILKEDFVWQGSSLAIERGANFYDRDEMILRQIIKDGVTLIFEWHGNIVDAKNNIDTFEDDILYRFENHRLFIKKNFERNLILIDFDIKPDAYIGFFRNQITYKLEEFYRIHHKHLFSRRLGSPFRVRT